MFDAVDVIVIERQPPLSAGMPFEIMLRERYGDKCTFVSPSTLHRAFHLQGYEYNGRKERCVQVVLEQLRAWRLDGVGGAEECVARIGLKERKHDMCDAILVLVFWLKTSRARYERDARAAVTMPFCEFIEQFRNR